MHKSGGIASCIVSASSLIQVLPSLLLFIVYMYCSRGATHVFTLHNQCLITVYRFHFDFTSYQGQ